MTVLSIDPAPAKGGTAAFLDPHGALKMPSHLTPRAIRGRIDEHLVGDGPHLVVWEAPLTGPNLEEAFDGRGGAYSTRPIEKAFSSVGLNPPDGISVNSYCACPHWTVSRAVLGRPQVGEFDAAQGLPCELVFAPPPENQGVYVSEIHSAVAIWIALGMPREDLSYKGTGRQQTPAEIFERLQGSDCFHLWQAAIPNRVAAVVDGANAWIEQRHGIGDDRLDALIGLLLGEVWLVRPDLVGVFGDLFTGSFLLPVTQEIQEQLGAWNANANPQENRWPIPMPQAGQ